MKMIAEGRFPLLTLRKRGPQSMISVIRTATDMKTFDKLLKEVFTLRNRRRITAKTILQSKSPYWFLYRRGLMTATTSKRIVNQNLKKCNNEKLNRIISKCFPSTYTNPAMEYGIREEKNALNAFLKIFKKSHLNPKIIDTGLILFDKAPYIGGTPDAILKCECCTELYLVEIKCPFRLAQCGTEGWKMLEYFDEHGDLKKSHTYFSQLNLYLGITGIQTGYFVVYARGDTIIREINFDASYFECQIQNMSEYYRNYYLPTVLGTKL